MAVELEPLNIIFYEKEDGTKPAVKDESCY